MVNLQLLVDAFEMSTFDEKVTNSALAAKGRFPPIPWKNTRSLSQNIDA